jgi:hypothetical protein
MNCLTEDEMGTPFFKVQLTERKGWQRKALKGGTLDDDLHGESFTFKIHAALLIKAR